MSSTSRSKKRSPPWTKPPFHFSLCFIIGLLIGFFHPFTPSPSSSIQLISYQETLKISPDPIQIPDLKTPPPPPPPPSPSPSLDGIPTSTRLLIIITTTRSNDPLQGPLIGRLARSLRLVQPPLLWVVVEDHLGAERTAEVLRRTGILYRHLTFKEKFTDVADEEHYQRNVALSHIEHHRIDGIVYFAGISNVYDLGFFEEIRGIGVFGAWPVAMVSAAGGQPEVAVEGPICNSSQVIGWYSKDMDSGMTSMWTMDVEGRRIGTTNTTPPTVNTWGFAFNSSILWDPERWGRHPTSFPDTSQDSMRFIQEVILEDDTKLKAIPSSCSRIMVWNLQIQSER